MRARSIARGQVHVRIVLAAIVVVHGLIHLMGFAKAFGLAALPALTQPISRSMGVVWLSAALLTAATGVALVAGRAVSGSSAAPR